MKYFLYVSEAKINMLYPQIEYHGQTKSKTVLKGGLGRWFGIERHIEKATSIDDNLFAKLRRVCDLIRNTEPIGSMEDLEHSWVEDSFSCYVSAPVESRTGTPVVLFHYQRPADCDPRIAQRQVLLVGSAAYLMPWSGPNGQKIDPLPPGGHWSVLNEILKFILDGKDAISSEASPYFALNAVLRNRRVRDDDDEKSIIRKTGDISLAGSTDGPFGEYKDQGPMIQVRSMFRILHRHEMSHEPGRNVVYLGTPLYVQWDNV